MKQQGDVLYLRHILDAIAKIETYLQGVDEVIFYKNTLIQDGVIRQLEIIGEAVRQISGSLRQRYPLTPWQDIAGMRDKLIHQYFGVDINLVWLTARDDIPLLQAEVKKILEDFEQP